MSKNKSSPLLIILAMLMVSWPVFRRPSVRIGAAGLAADKSSDHSLISRSADRQSSIIINGADSTIDKSFAYSQDLVDNMSAAGPTIIIEYADSTAPHMLNGIPSTLLDLINLAPTMIIVEYADSTAPYNLETLPPTLQSLVDSVPPHIIAEYADSTAGMRMAYPLALMNDNESPKIFGVSADGGGHISWSTDEFATSTVLYGVNTGVYTQIVSSSLFVKQHNVGLPELVSGKIYYYKTRSTDRSDNMATSSEYRFTAQSPTYLPLVVKNY